MKDHLEQLAVMMEVPIEKWTIIHVCTAWNAIRMEFLFKFTPNGWVKKMKDFKSALEITDCKSHKSWAKELNLYINAQLKEEIDVASAPYKKKGANKPPYEVWKKLIDFGQNYTKDASNVKQLRAAQGALLLNWTLSSGCRMDELLRLRKSDIHVSLR